MVDKNCGNCKWRGFDRMTEDWICYNGESEWFRDYAGTGDSCEKWEGEEDV